MRKVLITLAAIGLVMVVACGMMTVPGGSTSGRGSDLGIVGPDGRPCYLSTRIYDFHRIIGEFFNGLNGVGIYVQADEGENGTGEEKKEEEAPPVPSVDRLWDIVMSA